VSKPHRSTLRVVEILDVVRRYAERGVTFGELAQKIGVPKSSLLPIVHTLRDERFLAFDADGQRYRVGFAAYEVGQAYVRSSGIPADIRAVMEGIVKGSGETCYFGELRGNEVAYLLAVESPQPVRMVASVGQRLPAHGTAIGKALLAGMPREQLEALFPDGLVRITPNTITDMGVLVDQLTEVAATGVAYEKEESTPHIQCIAVPVIVGAVTRAAISVATPVFRFSDQKAAVITGLLKQAQPVLQRVVGAVPAGAPLFGGAFGPGSMLRA